MTPVGHQFSVYNDILAVHLCRPMVLRTREPTVPRELPKLVFFMIRYRPLGRVLVEQTVRAAASDMNSQAGVMRPYLHLSGAHSSGNGTTTVCSIQPGGGGPIVWHFRDSARIVRHPIPGVSGCGQREGGASR